MDDLVRSYFDIYGCNVVQESFESIGEKRYTIVENSEAVKKIIASGARDAGSKKKDLTGEQVKARLEKDKDEIRKALQKEENEIVIQALLDNGYASCYDDAEGIMEAMSDEWFEAIIDEKYVASMDYSGRGADRRAKGGKRRKPTPEEYKYSEAGFDSRASHTSPSARKRGEQRRGAAGGFNA